MAGGATTPRNSTGDATPRRSFTKSMSSLFRSKKKKDSMKADADSIRAESQREDPAPDAPVSAPVERPSTAPSTTAEPRYSNNYAAEAAPAAPTPAVVEPTPEPVPAVPKAEEPVAAPAPDEAVAAPDTEPGADEPVAAPEPVPQPAPLADVPAGPTAEEQAGATDSPLAPGWEEVEADDGRIYYWNEETDSTTWDKPSASRTPMDTSRTSAAVRCPASEPQPADPSLPSSREPPRRTAVGMRWRHGPGAACRAAVPVRQTERPKRALPQCAVCSPPPAQAAAYLQATGYRPKDPTFWLRHWNGSATPAASIAGAPVVYISLDEARLYCSWAGGRLPHAWEWQYAAQGTDGRLYPWGNNKTATGALPVSHSGNANPGPPPTGAHSPAGDSPFGVADMVGTVWQYTDEFYDEHTRFVILRGGSNYRPSGSNWYFPNQPELNTHNKYFLMSASYERAGTIGVRCVVDAQA